MSGNRAPLRGQDFAALQAFVAIAREGGFARAAPLLGVSVSALSQTLRMVEARLGVRLLNRTTRGVSLTEAGRRLLDSVAPGFALIGEAVSDATDRAARPAGRLRLNAPRAAVTLHLEPLLPRFLTSHPEIELDITINDAKVDLVAGGFDAGIRLGELLEDDMVAMPLGGEMRQAAVASPGYLARHGVPGTPEDLLRHRCINWRKPNAERPYAWEFFRDKAWMSVAVTGPLTVTDRSLCIAPALAGLGIAFMSEERLRPYLDAGTLVEVLRDYSAPFPGFYLYHHSRRHPPAPLRALISFLKQEGVSSRRP